MKQQGIEVIRSFVTGLPKTPGVYRMYGPDGASLYVGKARNLFNRVQHYARGTGHNNRIATMISLTCTMEFSVTHTETEALLLEANLIKKLRPRFNVLLRDDKSFPYVLIAEGHDFPQLSKHRGAKKQKGDYFGPFASAGSVNKTIDTLQKAFMIRTCNDSVFNNRTRPCLLHQIHRCCAPCVGKVSRDDYDDLLSQTRKFFSGESRDLQDQLAQRMEEAAADLRFEEAARLRDRIKALTILQSQQDINPGDMPNADMFALARDGGKACVHATFIRAGQNFGDKSYFPRIDQNDEDGDILEAFIAQFYDQRPAPAVVLISHPCRNHLLLGEALSAANDHKVTIHLPQRGRKVDLIRHGVENAQTMLARNLAEREAQEDILRRLGEHFGLDEPPQRIEIYDNSHNQGSKPVGVMVVAGSSGFEKSQYRKYNMDDASIPAGDDYGMMRHMFSRRFGRLARGDHGASPRPDLVLVDGGKGQLSACLGMLEELGLTDIFCVGVAKGPDRDAGREQIFVPGKPSYILKPNDPVSYFIQRLRDEAHRFAIGSHRARRARDIQSNPLDLVEGIGPARKKALLTHFGSAKAVGRAGINDLLKVEGISRQVAQKLYDYFHET